MTDKQRFTGHHKRVTVRLASLASCCGEQDGLVEALGRLSTKGCDFFEVDQEDVETVFSHLDSDMEERIISEYEVDPSHLEDHRLANQVCPLCGHEGLRFLFKIKNRVNGNTIKCGSTCIFQYGLSVRGAETAEHARKVLEATIRKHLRRLELEEWHGDYGFSEDHFEVVTQCFRRARRMGSYGFGRHHRAWRTCRNFYQRTGWLGTEKKWNLWREAVLACRRAFPDVREQLPYPPPFGQSDAVEDVAEVSTSQVVTPVPIRVELPVQRIPPRPAGPPTQEGDYNDMALSLIYE